MPFRDHFRNVVEMISATRNIEQFNGSVPERFNGLVLKTSEGATPP
jgi:hypothetical protein